MVAGKTKAKSIDLPCLRVMPQLGLIREDEAKLTVETVKKDMNTRLSSRHFRNELYLFRKERFNLFRETAQSTWRGLRIDDIEHDAFDNSMRLFVYESDHYSEIGLMGSGLQMWLQMIWFFIKCNPEDTICICVPLLLSSIDEENKCLHRLLYEYFSKKEKIGSNDLIPHQYGTPISQKSSYKR